MQLGRDKLRFNFDCDACVAAPEVRGPSRGQTVAGFVSRASSKGSGRRPGM
jgi:hypothetical protein